MEVKVGQILEKRKYYDLDSLKDILCGSEEKINAIIHNIKKVSDNLEKEYENQEVG